MMKIIIIIVMVLSPISLSAQSYKKILSKNDIIKYLPETSDGKADSFWKYVNENNEDFQSLINKINTKGGSAKKAREEISRNENIFMSLKTYNAHLDSFKYVILGNSPIAHEASINYLSFDEKNAFCTPKMDIFVFDGLLKNMPNMECFYAILAHEFAHGMFQHSLVAMYKQFKKEKENELIAGIATGMAIYNDSYSKARGVQSKVGDVREYSDIMNTWANIATSLFQCKYDREQEYQADIIAFRLLDWLGIGGENVILMLKTIQKPFEYFDEYDDHPTTQQRINLLEYMCNQKRVVPMAN